MGATTFLVTQQGIDPAQAFTSARATAKFETGHGGYTGTIAEKDHFVLIARSPLWLSAAQRQAQALLDADDDRIIDKWGPAGAIPYVAETKELEIVGLCGSIDELPTMATGVYQASKQHRRGEAVLGARVVSYQKQEHGTSQELVDATVVLTVQRAGVPRQRTIQFTYDVSGAVGYPALQGLLRTAAERTCRLRKGESIVAVRSDTPLRANVRRHKVSAHTTKGRAVTRYVFGDGSGHHETWETGFRTQAAARKYALEHATELRAEGGTITIEAVTRREDGSPLGEVLVDVVTTTLRATATVETAGAPTEYTIPDGWVFFGWAAY